MAKAPRGWRFVDEHEPPKGEDIFVWNGKHRSVARLLRSRFVGVVEGCPMQDIFEKPWIIKGVTHWQPLPKPPVGEIT